MGNQEKINIRSELWYEIYEIVKTLPREDCNGCDAPDSPSVATDLELLFLEKLSEIPRCKCPK